jgi:hypothetical protein
MKNPAAAAKRDRVGAGNDEGRGLLPQRIPLSPSATTLSKKCALLMVKLQSPLPHFI